MRLDPATTLPGWRSLEFDVEVLLASQHDSGAFPASAEFSQYGYCWLRDGAFVAHALDVAARHATAAGDRAAASRSHASAARFHRWVATTLERLEPEVEELLDRRAGGDALGEFDFLPARFTLDGAWVKDGWPNFQLDGYGQWLWSLAVHLDAREHVRAGELESAGVRHGMGAQEVADERDTLPAELAPAMRLAVRYLGAFWDQPCYDPWEEHRSQLHTATLASIHAGLRDIGRRVPEVAGVAKAAAAGTLRYILDDCIRDGHLIKYVRNGAVDASLLWLAVPFDLFAVDEPVMVATAARIESELLGGGVRRYLADTYYGGGEWILLTAWLAWYWLRAGRREDAVRLLRWVEEQRDPDGALPEQVPGKSYHPRFLAHWLRQWGPSAKPLLWSHAMVAVVKAELG